MAPLPMVSRLRFKGDKIKAVLNILPRTWRTQVPLAKEEEVVVD